MSIVKWRSGHVLMPEGEFMPASQEERITQRGARLERVVHQVVTPGNNVIQDLEAEEGGLSRTLQCRS